MATISEEKRIEFTKKLLELRDDVVDELEFPADLSNVERKFLHKISQDYGLKSKSSGKGDNRFITVRKHGAKKKTNDGNQSEPAIPVSWIPDLQTHKLLSDPVFLNAPQSLNIPARVWHPNAAVHAKKFKSNRFANSYPNAQLVRKMNNAYSSIQKKRHKLPAHEHVAYVLDAIRNNQIVLICGETGKNHKSTFWKLFAS